MEPTAETPINLADQKLPDGAKPTGDDKYLAFIKRQQKNQIGWVLTRMIIQGLPTLPVPAILLFYYDEII